MDWFDGLVSWTLMRLAGRCDENRRPRWRWSVAAHRQTHKNESTTAKSTDAEANLGAPEEEECKERTFHPSTSDNSLSETGTC